MFLKNELNPVTSLTIVRITAVHGAQTDSQFKIDFGPIVEMYNSCRFGEPRGESRFRSEALAVASVNNDRKTLRDVIAKVLSVPVEIDLLLCRRLARHSG